MINSKARPKVQCRQAWSWYKTPSTIGPVLWSRSKCMTTLKEDEGRKFAESWDKFSEAWAFGESSPVLPSRESCANERKRHKHTLVLYIRGGHTADHMIGDSRWQLETSVPHELPMSSAEEFHRDVKLNRDFHSYFDGYESILTSMSLKARRWGRVERQPSWLGRRRSRRHEPQKNTARDENSHRHRCLRSSSAVQRFSSFFALLSASRFVFSRIKRASYNINFTASQR